MIANYFTLYAITASAIISVGSALTQVENVVNVPEGWVSQGRPEQSDRITLSVALKQPKLDELKSRLKAISDPTSKDYAKRLSQESVENYRAASREDVDAVRSWLTAQDIVDLEVSRSWINFNTTVANGEKLLNTKFNQYSFNGGAAVIRALSYTVPEKISSAIDFVHPVTNFMATSRQPLRLDPLADKPKAPPGKSKSPCNDGTDPICIKSLYKINYTAPIGNSPVKFGIAGFLEEYINKEDTTTFIKRFAPEILETGYEFSVELINGGENRQSANVAGSEAALDVQYAMALGYPANVVYYSTGGRGTKLDKDGKPDDSPKSDNEPYLEFLEYLLARPDDTLPHVISISYADDELSVPQPYAIRMCDMFASLAARGVSVLAASGDGGARGTGGLKCYSNDGKMTEMTLPTFPASCPYVTAVGATTNSGPPVNGAKFSTGGFSNYFERPEWQDGVVKKYTKALNGTLDGRYNTSGRAFPDISAIGSGFVIQRAGKESRVLGTSASCPVVAAMIALVNDGRLRAGKGSVGWLNPILYSKKMRSVLQDVVEGESQSCAWNGDAPGGWPAKPGFDTITGLGVPNDFEKFFKVFMDLD
ncbi:Tripeptidyl-peptidase sed2 [Colletotrichum siamense]|uniref:Tripeptidyl-peptidase sed2 n=1 Tax=Colletotrichum siamense TaxID=690259 RepID=UPI0018723E9A|nr:Tripeptidyl-peptidase sed2 [Colletotrichum siamense]KAF5506766.1 Tripeptidyl-peptidase sed2 [Colletotrichum siamense]